MSKSALVVFLASCFLLMISCRKEDKLAPEQPVRAKLKANVQTLNDEDPVTASVSDIALGNDDYYYSDAGIYFNNINGESWTTNIYFGKLEVNARYRTRNLRVMITAPYEYYYDRPRGIVYKIGPVPGFEKPQLSFIGTMGDIVDTETFGGVSPSSANNVNQPLETDGGITYFANEKRTIIYSQTGEIKVMAGFKAEIIEVGSEISTGFTVQSAVNEMGYHSGDVYYTIKLMSAGGWTHFYPNFHRTGTLNGAFYGTVHD